MTVELTELVTATVEVTEPVPGWALAGIELGHSEITADFATTSTSYVDVTGLAVTVEIGNRPVAVTFSAGSLGSSAAYGGATVRILEGATAIGGSSMLMDAAAENAPAHRRVRRAPAAGTYTYKVQLKAPITGTATIKADTTDLGPASLSVVQV